MASKTKVTRKYQVTIPKEIRMKVGVKIGDEFKVLEKDELIILQKKGKVKELPAFEGCWQGYPKNPEKFIEDIRKMWSRWKA